MARRWVAFVAVLVAVVSIAYLVDVAGIVARFFGPPAVTMREAYSADQGTAAFDHAAYDRLLKQHVSADGLVDYERLGTTGRASLEAYLSALARAPVEDLGRDEKLALLLNAYNVFTLALVVEHYPLQSILEIPEAQRWAAARWNLGGRLLSLDQIEHQEIRARFREPRIHFALVCASLGCPKLRNEAYTGVRLDEQLNDQMRYSHSSPRWLRFDPRRGVLELTALYDWYRGDFEQVYGSVIAAVAPHSAPVRKAAAAGMALEIRFIDYDWALNDLSSGDRID